MLGNPRLPFLVALLAFFTTVLGGIAEPHARSIPIARIATEVWNQLNDSVSGRLHIGKPYGLPCFTTYRNSTGLVEEAPDPERCSAIGESLTEATALIQDFGSYFNPSFSSCMARGERCHLSPGSPQGVTSETCYQGTVPDYYIDVREVRDIQQGLEFARQHKIPVAIKNTGHDFHGKSTGLNSLALWTHNLVPELDINEDFTPDACEESVGPVVTYGAGQTFLDLYEQLEGTGYMIVGGACPTVGASGGWVAGGGHSPLTPNFGLGVDNVMQMKVVLPNGTFVTASRCQNQELFFALRGGGGGTFGVITETTTRLHEDRPFTLVVLSMNVPTGRRDVTEIIVANAETWADQGWGGLVGVNANNVTTILAVNPGITVDEARVSFRAVVEYFESVASEAVSYIASFTSQPNYAALQRAPEFLPATDSGTGQTVTRSTRLVPRDNFRGKEAQKELVDALMQHSWASLLVAPTNYSLPESDLPGGPGEASITPVWRNAVWHLTHNVFWDPADPESTAPSSLRDIFAQVSQRLDKLRSITPNGGAYINEADLYEPDRARSFWGHKNHNRLLRIKQELDPENLLTCYGCIGWDKADPRYQCYIDLEA